MYQHTIASIPIELYFLLLNRGNIKLLFTQYISDSKIIANSFNNYFINIGSSLASSIKSENDPLLYFQTNKKSIYIPEIDKSEIESIISSINNLSSGYDELPASIMKQCIGSYIDPLLFAN